MPAVTLVLPFYRNVGMLQRQLAEFEHYPPDGVRLIVVDDGSPEPARDVVLRYASPDLRARLHLYRITVDIPWNREGARNLGATKADTDWVVHVDIDHVLPAPAAARLVEYDPSPDFWYRFARYRNGAADETRQKDPLPTDAAFGAVKPHIDSYLITRDMYWDVGGYDEDFAGVLGGGTDFLKRLERRYGAPLMLPRDVVLHVYTRHVIPDASDRWLSRSKERGKQIQQRKGGTLKKPDRPLRFPWVREL